MFSRGKSVKRAPKRTAPAPPKRLGELLLEQNLITREQLDEGIAEQERSGGFLGQILVGLGHVTQEDITSCVVKQCKIPHLSLLDYDISPEVVALVPRETCLKYGLIPIDKLGRILTIAMVDPLDIDALEAVRQSCPDLRIKPILCNWHHFDTVVHRVFPESASSGGAPAMTTDSLGLSALSPRQPDPPKADKPPPAKAAPSTNKPSEEAPPKEAPVMEAAPSLPPAPPPPLATPSAAPSSLPAFSAAELGEVMRDGLREAMGDLVKALEARPAVEPAPAAPPTLDVDALATVLRDSMQETVASLAPAAPAVSPTLDMGALANMMRDALQESVSLLADELRTAVQPAPAAPAPDGQAMATIIQEGIAGALQEAMAVMMVQLRARENKPSAALPSPEALGEAIRESVTGAMQEAMATMMVQLRAAMGKKEASGLTKEALSEAMYASVREAFEAARQTQEEQGKRLAEIAEATLQAVQQTSHLVETATVADQNRRDLGKSRLERHASVAPFGGVTGPDSRNPEMDEADERVREALESEHPLESLTLDRFFPGKTNGFTFKLAQAVAARPGGEYNPFFLYGHVGIGKTHLISATGNAILANDPSRRVGYVSASHFSRRLAEALKDEAVDAFRENYCHWDVLILDDIQFMGGRVEAQEEFFHIFNVLYQQNRQIIIASDKAPDRLGLLEQRLISRFSSGIVAELKAPEWETRMEILRHCAKAAKVTVPEEILSLIAMRVTDDIRKMTGSLRKILAFSELVGQDMNVEMATEILSHLGSEQAA